MAGFNIPTPPGSVACHESDTDHGDGGPWADEFPSNTVETARSHRFLLEYCGPLGYDITMFLEKCTRPTPEFDEVMVHNGQDVIYRPGKNTWNPIEFTFYERTAGWKRGQNGSTRNQTAEEIYKWWAKNMAVIKNSRLGHTNLDGGFDARGDIEDEPATIYKDIWLSMLDGQGHPIWTYYIYDAWIQKVSPSDLSMSSSDICTTSVIMRFNKAKEFFSGRGD